MRYKKVKKFIEAVLDPLIYQIKRNRKLKTMPFKYIGPILNTLYPKTRYYPIGKGYFKRVFIVHATKNPVALKIGRSNEHVRRDDTTYKQLVNRNGEKKTNRYFAKIYWREGIFMLQKYGKPVKKVPERELNRLQLFAKNNDLIDIKPKKGAKPKNIMKFGKNYKIVDAERSKRKKRRKRKK